MQKTTSVSRILVVFAFASQGMFSANFSWETDWVTDEGSVPRISPKKRMQNTIRIGNTCR